MQRIADAELAIVSGGQLKALVDAVHRFTTTYKQESTFAWVFRKGPIEQFCTGCRDGWYAVRNPEHFERRQKVLEEYPFPYLAWRQKGEVSVYKPWEPPP
jgi:hypothetical protein